MGRIDPRGAIDARELPDGAHLEADLAIIGAGAAGIALARALAGARGRNRELFSLPDNRNNRSWLFSGAFAPSKDKAG